MPHHGRRTRPDPLALVNAPRWLVIRDELSRAVECIELPRLTDLRAALLEEREAREREGWQVEDVPPAAGFFFCRRGDSRLCICVESFAPGTAPLG